MSFRLLRMSRAKRSFCNICEDVSSETLGFVEFQEPGRPRMPQGALGVRAQRIYQGSWLWERGRSVIYEGSRPWERGRSVIYEGPRPWERGRSVIYEGSWPSERESIVIYAGSWP